MERGAQPAGPQSSPPSTPPQSVMGTVGRALSSPLCIAVAVAVLSLAKSASHPLGNDEGIWSYVSWNWIHNGSPPYVGSVENKPPGIFYLFTLSTMMCGVGFVLPRLLGCVCIVLSSVLSYRMASLMLNRVAGVTAMALCGFAMLWPMCDGPLTAQTETFQVTFSLLAFYLALLSCHADAPRRRIGLLLLSGISIGVAISFKQVAAFTALGVAGMLIALGRSASAARGRLALDICLLALGALVAVALMLLPLLVSGVSLGDCWDGAYAILLQAPGATLKQRIDTFSEVMMGTRLVLFYPLALYFVLSRRMLLKHGIPFWGLLAWLAADFVATNASGHYFGHQLKQLIPSLSIIGGLAIAATCIELSDKAAHARWMVFVWAAVLVWALSFTPREAVSTFGMFTRESPDQAIAAWVRANTTEDDYVYIFGQTGNPVQALAGRTSPSRYFNLIFLGIPGAEEELRGDLAAAPPKIVLVGHNARIAAWVREYLDGGYLRVRDMDRFTIYMRRDADR